MKEVNTLNNVYKVTHALCRKHICHYDNKVCTIDFSHEAMDDVYKFLRKHPIIKRNISVSLANGIITISNK